MKTARTTIMLTVICGAALVLTALPASAGQNHLLTPSANDLTATALVDDAPAVSPDGIETEPVNFAWPLDPSSALKRDEVHTSTSYEYRLVVSSAELKSGVEITTHGSAAVIRLNPATSTKVKGGASIHPESLLITDPLGGEHPSGAAMESLASAEQIKAAGAPFAEGTSAFRLRSDLGIGTFRLSAPDLELNDSSYLIHVLDKDSDLGLSLTTVAQSFLVGQPFKAMAFMVDSKKITSVTGIRGSVVSPSGARMPVTFSPSDDGGFRVSLELPAERTLAPGLWEISATLTGEANGISLRRDVRTAFSCAAATARLSGAAEAHRDSDTGVTISLQVEVAVPSRYEIRGVLYGSNSDGELKPAAISHSATWLGVGFAPIELEFPIDVLAEAGLKAPYELHDLQLLDQGRMGVLHIQERALLID